MKHLIVADAHVHIHNCFNIKKFFETARKNLFTESQKIGFNKSFTGILFLTESKNANWFLDFKKSAKTTQKENIYFEDLKFQKTKEDSSLKIILDDGRELIIIAGRQIISQENLEVLGLGIIKHFGEGNPLSEIVSQIQKRDGIPIIPWGVGKWLGKRGIVVSQFINENNSKNLFLGDNSGRPIFWKNPSHFKQASQKNISILPGSDPLPFSSEYKKVGSFGFVIKDEIDMEFPAKSIKALLLNSKTSIQCYGALENPIRFLKNQFLMQLKKFNE